MRKVSRAEENYNTENYDSIVLSSAAMDDEAAKYFEEKAIEDELREGLGKSELQKKWEDRGNKAHLKLLHDANKCGGNCELCQQEDFNR